MIDLIRSHFNIDVIQIGFHEMHPNVTGKDGYEGFMVKKMRYIFELFEFETFVAKKTTFKTCSPDPSQTPDTITRELYKNFVIICLLNYMEMYFLRVRRVICSYFYRIRAKKRTLFLYNQTLKKRKGFLRYSIQKVRQLVQQKLFEYPDDNMSNFFAYGLITWIDNKNCSLLMKIIKYLLSFYYYKTCIVCDEYLPDNQKFIKCQKKECPLNYCIQCWNECNQICIVCGPKLFPDY